VTCCRVCESVLLKLTRSTVTEVPPVFSGNNCNVVPDSSAVNVCESVLVVLNEAKSTVTVVVVFSGSNCSIVPESVATIVWESVSVLVSIDAKSNVTVVVTLSGSNSSIVPERVATNV